MQTKTTGLEFYKQRLFQVSYFGSACKIVDETRDKTEFSFCCSSPFSLWDFTAISAIW
jgi:hypothetical protein